MLPEDLFPALATTGYRLTSPIDQEYNCIAWALGLTDDWWWPGPEEDSQWPENLARIESIESFESLFIGFGFELCAEGTLEPSLDKLALFANRQGLPTHAARQLSNGLWTSKLGKSEDIEYELRAIEGDVYGTVVRFFRRPTITPP